MRENTEYCVFMTYIYTQYYILRRDFVELRICVSQNRGAFYSDIVKESHVFHHFAFVFILFGNFFSFFM